VGYTARKFFYKARCHLDVPATATLGSVNEASPWNVLTNCIALLNVSSEENERPLLLSTKTNI